MSEQDEHDLEATEKKKRKRKTNPNTRRLRNREAMRRLRAENPEYCESERVKKRLNTEQIRCPQKLNGISFGMSPSERNKLAMQSRRSDEDYRKQEAQKNRAAMRKKRNDGEFRERENEKKKIYMKMKRSQRKLAEEMEFSPDFHLKIEFSEEESEVSKE